MTEIDYFQMRCARHRELAREATSLAVVRAHLAFVDAYRRRLVELIQAERPIAEQEIEAA